MCVFYKTFAVQRYNFFSTSTRKHAKIFIFCFYLHYFKDHFLSQGDIYMLACYFLRARIGAYHSFPLGRAGVGSFLRLYAIAPAARAANTSITHGSPTGEVLAGLLSGRGPKLLWRLVTPGGVAVPSPDALAEYSAGVVLLNG